jgi:hypothetical protein
VVLGDICPVEENIRYDPGVPAAMLAKMYVNELVALLDAPREEVAIKG